MTRVKICGIRRPEDARLALDLGAWALGFIFHKPSPRYIDPEDAKALVAPLPARVKTVGVFVDWPLEKLNAVVEQVGLSAVQLHGRETPDYAAEVCSNEVWKAFRVGGDFDVAVIDRYAGCHRILLDAYHPDRPGGTGETFDWNVAERVQAKHPILLAGGLSPSNVEDAIRAVQPAGIDVSSGVEAGPGVKDHEKLRELFAKVEALAKRQSETS